MAKKNNAKSELGKFLAVIGTVIGVAGCSIFLLNQFVFDSKNALPVKTAAPKDATQKISTEVPPNLGEESTQESSEAQTVSPISKKASTAAANASEPFYASLQMGEYVAIYNQDGTDKVLSFDMTKEEVKTLLGKPQSEAYVDGETRSLCYNYGPFSIFFDENDQYISYMTYEGKKELLEKQWLSSLTKTLDTGNVDFYESPTGYTSVKVDYYPENNDVVVYMLKSYPQNEHIATPQPEQSHVVQTPAPQAPSAAKEERTNAKGEYVMSPGEEILIENVQVTNNSKVHTAKYTIDVNYHFAYNSPNMVKVITDPEKNLELMPGETATVQIKVKSSKSAPKASYRFIVSLKQGWSSQPLKEFTVEVK